MGSVKAGWLILLSFLAGAEMWAQASSIPGKTASSTTPAQTADSVAESAARRLEAWEVDLPDNVPSLLDRIDWNETLVIGERQKAQGTYTYRLDGLLVGMEQWENGKRSEHFREQWNLGCSPDTSSSQAANCSLIRTRLMLWGLPTGGTVVRVNRYSTNERTLRLHRIDWNAGVFDFTLWEPDLPSTEVAARFFYDGDVMRLQSLRASSLSTSPFGNPPTAVEFRVSSTQRCCMRRSA